MSLESLTQKQGMKLLDVMCCKPKRVLSLWDFGFVKYMIRNGRRNRDDSRGNVGCKRCGKEILYGLQIELCRGCYEQSEIDYLTNGLRTPLEGMIAEILEHEECEMCGKVTATRMLHKKEHCHRCFRKYLGVRN